MEPTQRKILGFGKLSRGNYGALEANQKKVGYRKDRYRKLWGFGG